MYYKNKETFYIMQYGPKVLVITIFTIALLFGGSYYLKKNNINEKTLIKAFQDIGKKQPGENVIEENASKDETELEVASISDFRTCFKKEEYKPLESTNLLLSKLEKDQVSKEVNVIAINDINNIIIEDTDGTKYTVCMIGIKPTASLDISKEKADYYKKDLETLLKNEKVQIKFDSLKNENNLHFAYVYYKGELLNSKILEYGYSKMKIENSNIANNEKLQKAQAKAKEANIEIWQK